MARPHLRGSLRRQLRGGVTRICWRRAEASPESQIAVHAKVEAGNGAWIGRPGLGPELGAGREEPEDGMVPSARCVAEAHGPAVALG